jgi:serine/threonine protein kinase
MNDPHSHVSLESFDSTYVCGSGGFASVLASRHLLSGVDVTLKSISQDSTQCELPETRVIREITIMRQLKHPFIVELFAMNMQ